MFVLYGSSMTNMTSFLGLRCVGTLWMSDNPTLTTLAGLSLVAVPPGGLIYDSTTSNLTGLNPVTGLVPLYPLAKCMSPQVSGNTEIINLQLLGCNVTSWDQVCLGQAFGVGPCVS
jgi:hypothetical protein